VILLPFPNADIDGNYGVCPECKAERIRTASGAVCPQGHGRIVPIAVNQSLFLKSLPIATRIGSTKRWQLKGKRGEYQTAVVRPNRSSWLARRTTRGDLPRRVTFARVANGTGVMAFTRLGKKQR
jgi:hypothetical protein